MFYIVRVYVCGSSFMLSSIFNKDEIEKYIKIHIESDFDFEVFELDCEFYRKNLYYRHLV